MQCTFKIKRNEQHDIHPEDELLLVKETIADAFGVDVDEVEIIEYMQNPM